MLAGFNELLVLNLYAEGLYQLFEFVEKLFPFLHRFTGKDSTDQKGPLDHLWFLFDFYHGWRKELR